ncbi:hypothetical protein ACG91E_04395, partial [Acinetobacter nosocomialis]
MIFNRGSVFIFSYFLITSLNAGEIGAKLTSQIELLPSCSINNKIVENNTANLNFGSLDFGEATTAFNGVLEASLINNGNSGLQIQCAGISTVKIIFGSGNNDKTSCESKNHLNLNFMRYQKLNRFSDSEFQRLV